MTIFHSDRYLPTNIQWTNSSDSTDRIKYENVSLQYVPFAFRSIRQTTLLCWRPLGQRGPALLRFCSGSCCYSVALMISGDVASVHFVICVPTRSDTQHDSKNVWCSLIRSWPQPSKITEHSWQQGDTEKRLGWTVTRDQILKSEIFSWREEIVLTFITHNARSIMKYVAESWKVARTKNKTLDLKTVGVFFHSSEVSKCRWFWRKSSNISSKIQSSTEAGWRFWSSKVKMKIEGGNPFFFSSLKIWRFE